MTNYAILERLYKIAENLEPVSALIEDVKKEIATEEAKRAGRGNALKAARDILKNANRDDLRGAWINKAGRQHICDGFRLVILDSPLDLPGLPANVAPVDYERIMEAPRHNSAALVLPDPAELAAFVKSEKARKKATADKTPPVYKFGNGLPWVNAAWLLGLLELLPGASAFASSIRPTTSAIYFKSEAGESILLPVRQPKGGAKND